MPTADMRRLGEADALLICVPTPLNDSRDPDLTFVEQTAEQIAAVLRPGQLVVLESTTYPGTTRDVVLPILATEAGLQAGRDFFLAFSPEREDPGNPNFTAARHSQGRGRNRRGQRPSWPSALLARPWPRSCRSRSCEVAEACKILENTYRAVNIALVNELKMLFDADGHRRLGGDRRRQDQAVRLPGRFIPAPGWAGTASPSTRSI